MLPIASIIQKRDTAKSSVDSGITDHTPPRKRIILEKSFVNTAKLFIPEMAINWLIQEDPRRREMCSKMILDEG